MGMSEKEILAEAKKRFEGTTPKGASELLDSKPSYSRKSQWEPGMFRVRSWFRHSLSQVNPSASRVLGSAPREAPR